MSQQAIEHVRRLRGGAQSHLMRCEDGGYYVVKFQNNPQGIRILANEMMAGKLAQALGLPVAQPDVVEVSDWLIEHTPELYMDWGNRRSFWGMLVFDKWTCNCDSRQSVFYRPSGGDSSPYVAAMVDQGFCFNANEWNFPDAPLRGLCMQPSIYAGVVGLESFEPFLIRLENLSAEVLEEAAAAVPPEWYEGKTEELGALLSALAERRRQVAPMLLELQQSPKRPFPAWRN